MISYIDQEKLTVDVYIPRGDNQDLIPKFDVTPLPNWFKIFKEPEMKKNTYLDKCLEKMFLKKTHASPKPLFTPI